MANTQTRTKSTTLDDAKAITHSVSKFMRLSQPTTKKLNCCDIARSPSNSTAMWWHSCSLLYSRHLLTPLLWWQF